jgi:hypothetical protein
MTPDPNAQQERQLWAAYRLILSWPKRDVGQRDPDPADVNQADKPQRDDLATVEQ